MQQSISNPKALACALIRVLDHNNMPETDLQSDLLSDHCAQQLAMVSVAAGEEKCHRGLERVTVPTLGLEIVRRRKLVISSVVLAQRNLQGLVALKEEKLEALRMISESQSLPARKFAKAMGVVDAMGALLEYQTTA